MKFVSDYEAKISAATVADVNAAIVKYMNPTTLVHVYAGDFVAAAKRAAEAPKAEAAK